MNNEDKFQISENGEEITVTVDQNKVTEAAAKPKKERSFAELLEMFWNADPEEENTETI